jgi:hypothetical protein
MSHRTKAKQTAALDDEKLLIAAVQDAAKEIAGAKVHVTATRIGADTGRGSVEYIRTSTGWECYFDSDYENVCDPFHKSVERQYKAHSAAKRLKQQGYVGIKIESKPREARIRVTARRV